MNAELVGLVGLVGAEREFVSKQMKDLNVHIFLGNFFTCKYTAHFLI